MMKDNQFPYPCNNCDNVNVDNCSHLCQEYMEWFKEEWENVTKPFRDLKRERDERRGNEQQATTK